MTPCPTYLCALYTLVLIDILESNECPCEEEIFNAAIDVTSRLTRVFALNYFRRDYTTADVFMDKLWMDLDSFESESHSIVPETGLPELGNKPVCYRGVVEGGEYTIQDATGQNGTGIVDIAFRLQVWLLSSPRASIYDVHTDGGATYAQNLRTNSID